MTDFFTRLAQRSLGLALAVQPIVASMFEPENKSGDAEPGVLEAVEDTSIGQVRLAAPMPDISVQASGKIPTVYEPPPLLDSRQPDDRYISPLQEHHTETREAMKEAVVQLLSASQEPVAHPVRQPRSILSEPALPGKDVPPQEQPLNEASKQKWKMPGQRVREFPAPIMSLHQETTGGEQKMGQNSAMVAAEVKYDRPSFIEPGDAHAPNSITGPVAPQQDSADDVLLPAPTRVVLHNALVQDELVSPVTPALRQESPTHSRQAAALGKNTAASPMSVSAAITHLIGEERDPSRLETLMTTIERLETGVSAPAPTVQITIGRVDVRAMPAPKSDVQPRQQRSAPTAMGLDEYLCQRSKGGRS